MRYDTLLLLLLLTACNSGSEIVTSRVSEPYARIVEYTPAPGQFINEPKSGFDGVTDAATACAYAEKRLARGNYISLGGWGGYIVAAFAAPVIASNDYDLWVKGNTQGPNTSEPGVVWIMQDTNGDGEANDTWYELRGSRYDDPKTLRGYRITYTRSAEAMPITWIDNLNAHGSIGRMDEFGHTQPSYYPQWIASPTLTLEGTRLPDNVTDGSFEGQPGWFLTAFEWGYADNLSATDAIRQVNQFRIIDAVTATGSPANLVQADFIKVQTGVNSWCTGIGEISTEVCGIGCYRTYHENLE